MSSDLDPLRDQLVLPAAGDRPRPAAARLQREDDVLAHRQLLDEPFDAPVLGAERDLPLRRRPRAAHRHRRAVEEELPGVRPIGAEQEPRRLGAPGAEQAGEADDLARPQREIERRDRVPAGDATRLQHRRRSLVVGELLAGLPLERLERLELAPEHLRDELHPRQLGRRPLADETPVAQDGDPVRDLVHLLEEVRDEDDRDPLLLQTADELEELRHLLLVEARRGLVEDQNLGGDVDRPRDRDHLLDGERVAAECGRDVDLDADAGERLGGAAPHSPPTDAPEAPRLAADRDVLGDRQVGAEIDLLVDGADARALGVQRMGELRPAGPRARSRPASSE